MVNSAFGGQRPGDVTHARVSAGLGSQFKRWRCLRVLLAHVGVRIGTAVYISQFVSINYSVVCNRCFGLDVFNPIL